MALSSFWISDEGYDLHVLRNNQKSHRLDEIVAIQGPTNAYKLSVLRSNLALISEFSKAEFIPRLIGNINSGFYESNGIRTNMVTGEIQVAGSEINRKINSFILDLHIYSKSNPSISILGSSIRINLHESLVRAWNTPPTLDLCQGTTGVRLSVLAEFDDNTVGDITRQHNINWGNNSGAASKGVTVNSSGVISVATSGTVGTEVVINSSLPSALGNLSMSSKIVITPSWKTMSPVANLIAGSAGLDKINEVPNVLLLCDGLLSSEAADFDKLTDEIFNRLKSPSTFPWNHLLHKVNVWRLFIPSSESGSSVLYPIAPVNETGPDPTNPSQKIELATTKNYFLGTTIGILQERFGNLIPMPSGAWSLAEMVEKIGLPTLSDSGAIYSERIELWTQIIGSQITTTNIPEELFNVWKRLKDVFLLDEQNTALQISTGGRPKFRSSSNRSILYHPLRFNREDLDVLLKNVKASNNTSLGHLWTKGASGTIGKDFDLVVMLSYGGTRGGANTPPTNYTEGKARAELIALSLTSSPVVNFFNVAGREYKIQPQKTSFINNDVAGTLAHELTHSYRIGDEYQDGLKSPTPSEAADVNSRYDNLQSEASLLGSDGKIKGGKIKWNWPRISKSGLLSGAPTAIGSTGEFKAILKSVSSNLNLSFQPNDIVYLRKPPLPNNRDQYSGALRIVQIVDGIDVTLKAEPNIAINFNDYPVGSLLIMLVPDADPAVTKPAGLVSKLVIDKIDDSGLPLTEYPCVPTATKNSAVVVPVATHLPEGLKKPSLAYQIVGLYKEGAKYQCGIYHPTGSCLMRSSTDDKQNITPLCPVCSYILVDSIDPTIHGEIDLVYSANYPQK